MATKENSSQKKVVTIFAVLFLLTLGSLIYELNVLDAAYMIVIVVYLMRYIFLKRGV